MAEDSFRQCLPRPIFYRREQSSLGAGATLPAPVIDLVRSGARLRLIGETLESHSGPFRQFMDGLIAQGAADMLALELTELVHAHGGGRIVELTHPLITLLLNTDFDATEQIPISEVRLPYPVSLYIHAPSEHPELRVPDGGGSAPLDGFYVRSSLGADGESCGLDLFCISQALDDAPGAAAEVAYVSLSLSWDAEQRHAAVIAVIEAKVEEWRGRMDAELVPDLQRLLDFVLKALVYINLPDARRRVALTETELRRRMAGVGPKKLRRLERQLDRTWDRVIVGPTTVHEEIGGPPDPHRHLSPHLRRGHFRRQRFGESLSQSKIIWIRPAFVNVQKVGAGDEQSLPMARDMRVQA